MEAKLDLSFSKWHIRPTSAFNLISSSEWRGMSLPGNWGIGIIAIEVWVCSESSAKTFGDPGNGCDDQKMDQKMEKHLSTLCRVILS